MITAGDEAPVALVRLRVQVRPRVAEVIRNYLKVFQQENHSIFSQSVHCSIFELLEWNSFRTQILIFVDNVWVGEVCALYICLEVPDRSIHMTLIKGDCF